MWMTASMRYFNFRCSHFQRQQWEYYVTASWVPYHEHYVIRPIPFCRVKVAHLAQMIYLDHQLWATAKNNKKTVP